MWKLCRFEGVGRFVVSFGSYGKRPRIRGFLFVGRGWRCEVGDMPI